MLRGARSESPTMSLSPRSPTRDLLPAAEASRGQPLEPAALWRNELASLRSTLDAPVSSSPLDPGLWTVSKEGVSPNVSGTSSERRRVSETQRSESR